MSADSWIERVRAADAEAEEATSEALAYTVSSVPVDRVQMYALVAIAAELRAARIARRPGAGQ